MHLFKNQLPNPKTLTTSSILIYDIFLEKNNSPEFKDIRKWIAQFKYRIGYAAGEDLKDLKNFPKRIEEILTLVNQIGTQDVQIIGLGGGSIGDFAGFAASIIKRGVPLIHIPTTWLAAMDSSHGGKTALNVGGYKNQIGSFYAAQKIIIAKSILFKQPPALANEAFGEAIKIALLTGGDLWKRFSKVKVFNSKTAWEFLPDLIDGKYLIVSKDPYEKLGIRHLLNLGHTFGHAWEASQKIPHGIAVAYGIRASIELSLQEKIMTPTSYASLHKSPAIQLLPSKEDLRKLARKTKNLIEYLSSDKKLSKNGHLRFIYIKLPGKCLIQNISIEKLKIFTH